MDPIDVAQIHMAYELESTFPKPWPRSSRHAAFSLASPEALLELQKRIWAHKQKGGKAAALSCDAPGEENSHAKVTFSVSIEKRRDEDESNGTG